MTSRSFGAWLGRQEVCSDQITAAPLRQLAAMLDHSAPPWRDNELPPLSHWLFHSNCCRQCDLGADGHPGEWDFLPPASGLRRMWAGSRVRFLRSVAIGAETVRRTTIADITTKMGSTGELLLVTLRHEILCAQQLAIQEDQDIAYLSDPPRVSEGRSSNTARLPTQATRAIRATPQLLFRFSALTFNAHRIHYDRDYACNTEHYPGLVVQGPLLATLLVDLYLRQRPAAAVTRFSFRALAPVFEGNSFTLCMGEPHAGGSDLWVLGSDGQPKMTARLETHDSIAD